MLCVRIDGNNKALTCRRPAFLKHFLTPTPLLWCPGAPLARAVTTPYYLRSNNALSTQKPGSEPPTSFEFDPHHPVPTVGGNISSHNAPPSRHNTIDRPGDSENLMEQGAYDQRCRVSLWTCDDTRPLSARNDVLVFQTGPLEQDVEVTGRLIVELWASSNAPDTDFTAKLVDVYPANKDFPEGVELNIGDSIVRGRYRSSLEHSELMKAGEVYPFTNEMYPTSLVFQKGHRPRGNGHFVFRDFDAVRGFIV